MQFCIFLSRPPPQNVPEPSPREKKTFDKGEILEYFSQGGQRWVPVIVEKAFKKKDEYIVNKVGECFEAFPTTSASLRRVERKSKRVVSNEFQNRNILLIFDYSNHFSWTFPKFVFFRLSNFIDQNRNVLPDSRIPEFENVTLKQNIDISVLERFLWIFSYRYEKILRLSQFWGDTSICVSALSSYIKERFHMAVWNHNTWSCRFTRGWSFQAPRRADCICDPVVRRQYVRKKTRERTGRRGSRNEFPDRVEIGGT